MTLWDKQDVDFWQNAKVISAGLDAAIVFQQVRAINAKQRRDGTLKPRESSPYYIAALLGGVGFDLTRTQAGIDRCLKEDLLARGSDGSLSIVGWDETWAPAKAPAERMRDLRGRRNGTKRNGVTKQEGTVKR